MIITGETEHIPRKWYVMPQQIAHKNRYMQLNRPAHMSIVLPQYYNIYSHRFQP